MSVQVRNQDDRGEEDPDVLRLRKTFVSGKTRPYEWRLQQLKGIERFITEQRDAICECVGEDHRRHKHETLLTEVLGSELFVRQAIAELKEWMKPRTVDTVLEFQAGESWISWEPKGVILVLAPWNFPVLILMDGLISSVAAGNCCFLKPTDVAKATELFVCSKLMEYVDSDAICVRQANVDATKELLNKNKWDHIVFTGSASVARTIAQNPTVAGNLTPCTFELGGKNPAIVTKSALWNGGLWRSSARPGVFRALMKRLLRGKFQNCGQVCMSPDYVLVHHELLGEFVRAAREIVLEWYGEDPQKSSSLSRLINHRHWGRVKRLKEGSRGGGSPVIALTVGVEDDEADCYMAPTLLVNPRLSDPVLKEEIFGPLLPVLSYGKGDKPLAQEISELVKQIDPQPLHGYIFGFDSAEQDTLRACFQSGGVTVNETNITYGHPELPFGGVGTSGVGHQHGRFGFEELSYKRSHYKHYMLPFQMELVPFIYPPFSNWSLKTITSLMVAVKHIRKAKYAPILAFFLYVLIKNRR